MPDTDENGLVRAYNRLFDNKGIDGIAYRRVQAKYSSQFLDIMVDTANPQLPDIAIEHKSYKTKSSNKLYFSQHFSDNTEDNFLESTHQVERVQEFCKKAGYKPFLAVEVRRGPGRSIRLFIIPWSRVLEEFRKWRDNKDGNISGFTPEWMKAEGLEIKRDKQKWQTLKETFNFEDNYL